MQIYNINADKALAMQAEGATIVDVRTTAEWNQGHAVGALHLPIDAFTLEAVPTDGELIFICASGARSLQAARVVAASGRDVYNVVGGMTIWNGMQLPVE